MIDVLLVDDNEDEHLLVPRFLGQGIDANFYSARSIPEAERIIKSRPIDLVLLDLFIPGPGKDGFVFLMRLKLNPKLKHIPVILFSNSVARTDREVGLKLGASAFLVKMDFNYNRRQELIDKVKWVLEGNKEVA